jgi:hypothetical protein
MQVDKRGVKADRGGCKHTERGGPKKLPAVGIELVSEVAEKKAKKEKG